ncbi:MAG: cob(I)yrinic acid a,c-diamide adenosyltransferase [Propionicimonas sp.]
MPNVYTRTGDSGQTGLFGGSRVPKQSRAVEAYGTVDEANAAIGAAKAAQGASDIRDDLHGIQQRLFVVAAELASDAKGRDILDNKVGQADIEALEHLIDRCLAFTGPQRQFVVPGRDAASASLHQARTVVRRAERRMLTLAEEADVRPELIKYVNRLSDTVYALARVVETRHDQAVVEQIVREAVGRALGAASLPEAPESSTAGVWDLATTKRLAAAAEARAAALGVPIVFAACDPGGHLMLLHRMEDSLLGSIDIATNKAFTSAAFKLPTDALAAQVIPGGSLYGIELSNDGRVVVFGGGMPVFLNGRLAGAIGVSGGTVEQDMDIAQHALRSEYPNDH